MVSHLWDGSRAFHSYRAQAWQQIGHYVEQRDLIQKSRFWTATVHSHSLHTNCMLCRLLAPQFEWDIHLYSDWGPFSVSYSKPPPPVLVDVQFLSSWNGANRLQLTTLLAVYILRRLMDWAWLPTHLSLYTWKLECDWWDRPTTSFIGMSWIRQGWACEMYDSNQLVSSRLYFWQEFWVVHCDTFGEVSPISIHWL